MKSVIRFYTFDIKNGSGFNKHTTPYKSLDFKFINEA